MISDVRATGRTHPDRIRIEAAAGRLRHSDRGDPHRPDRSAKRSRRRSEIGYPVVLKLYSETITHKTDVGGVQLNLRDADAVRERFRRFEASVTEKAARNISRA